jgi:hypothetical protein
MSHFGQSAAVRKVRSKTSTVHVGVSKAVGIAMLAPIVEVAHGTGNQKLGGHTRG